jgi:DNA invertase Pin-like site-specific DNA recombinase
MPRPRAWDPSSVWRSPASGPLAWRARRPGRLRTEPAPAGDLLLCAEISRMVRSTLQRVEMVEHGMRRQVRVHIAQQQLRLNGPMHRRMTATVFGLAAAIEREMMALRTTEA